MDITLDDLIALEPRLVMLSDAKFDADSSLAYGEREISWAVTARSTPPHMPTLRGGEILLLSQRVISGLGPELLTLMNEASLREISAFVVSSGSNFNANLVSDSRQIPFLEWNGELNAEAETLINRQLAECRGNLYRIGSELERQAAELVARGTGISALAQVTAAASGLPVVLEDSTGRRIASAPNGEDSIHSLNTLAEGCEIRRTLSNGSVFVLGPLQLEQRVVARFLEGRIVALAEAALRRDEEARPRGARRIEAIEKLVSGRLATSSDQRASALSLGMDPDAVYFVAVCHGEDESSINRSLSLLGTAFISSQSVERKLVLIAANGRAAASGLSGRVADVKNRWERDHAEKDSTLALSAPARGVASLPSAAREANFVANLQAQNELPRKAASFESVDDIGALRLLYQLRDSNELRNFVSEALGSLENRDQRGTLRATLRAFLESGGSQVEASSRLGIHRNTLAYRLRRIGELVGRDVLDPGSWLTLHLALSAAQMLRVNADDDHN